MRLDVNVDAYVPPDYIPYEQAKIDVHRRIAGAREVAELEELREELDDRFGDVPEPLSNLITLQQARIKLGQAGARAVSFRGGRLAVTPIELDSVRARKLRAEIPGRDLRVRAARSSRCAFPTTPGSASPRSSMRPTCCSRFSVKPPDSLNARGKPAIRPLPCLSRGGLKPSRLRTVRATVPVTVPPPLRFS